MAKLKDGFYKLTAEAIGNNSYMLLAGGGSKALSDFATASGVVTALGTNGNLITWTKNGTANNLTVPYATTAGSADSIAWGNVTDKPSTFTPSAHNHSYIKGSDHRDVNNTPGWYTSNIGKASVYTEFSLLGGAVSVAYENRTTFIPWSDSSGGLPVQLSFSSTNGIYMRTSKSAEEWNSWNKIIHSGNYTSYLPFLNSTSTHATKNSVIYAPTSAGTYGSFLVSNSSGAPFWSTLKTRMFSLDDNQGRDTYLLIADLSNWKPSTTWDTSLIGTIYGHRVGNLNLTHCYNIVAQCTSVAGITTTWRKLYTTTWTYGTVLPYIVKYNDKNYLALKKQGSGFSIYFIGYITGLLSSSNYITLNVPANKTLPDGMEIVHSPSFESHYITTNKLFDGESGHAILHSGNYTSYVNTTNFPGLNSIGDITEVIAGDGLSGGGTSGSVTLTNAGVRSTTINGNYLSVNTNGTNTDLTIPYAVNADTVDNLHASDFKQVSVSNISYTPNLTKYGGGTVDSTYYYKVSISNVNNRLTMLYLEMDIKENYLNYNSGKLIIGLNKDSNNYFSRVYALILGTLSNSIKVYVAQKSTLDVYIAGNWKYSTVDVSRLNFGDNSIYVSKSITLDITTTLPSTYTTANIIRSMTSNIDYYWANVKISDVSSEETTPTFSTIATTGTSYVATLRPSTTETHYLGSVNNRWRGVFSQNGNFSGQIISSVADGTAPFIITSTTKVDNLNADTLDGYHASSLFKHYGWNNSTVFTDANSISKIFGMIFNQLGNSPSSITNYPTNYGFMLSFCPGESTYTGILLYMNDSGSNIYIRDRWSSGTWNTWRLLIHNGNIGSQSVNYASSAGSVAWENVSGRPTVGDGTVTIKQGGTTKGSFTMNQSGSTTIELTANTTYELATSNTLGLVKIGYEANAKNYPIELNDDGLMYVNVPWTDDNTWRTVQCNGTSIGNNTLNLKAGSNITLSNTSGTITIASTNTWRSITSSVSTTDDDVSASATAVKAAYDKAVSAYNLANGKTDNTGTVTSVTITQGTGITVSNSGTAITTSGTRTISLNSASSSAIGGVQLGYTASGANIPLQTSSNKGYVALTKAAVVAALGYTPPTSDTNTNYYHTRAYSSGLKISTGTGVSDMYVPTGTTSTLGVVRQHTAADCTTYTSDDGATTPAAVKKAIGTFVSVSRSLTSGTKIGTITINGTETELYCQTGSSTDTNVTQTNSTTTTDYRVLLSGSATDTSETTTSYKSSKLKFNPGTGTMSVGGIYSEGALYLTGVNGIIAQQVIKSTVPDGTKPMEFTSKTKVDNLNADMVDGYNIWTGTRALYNSATKNNNTIYLIHS